MIRTATSLLVATLISATGCKSISPEAEAELAQPTNCSTAHQDIATLEEERASVAERMLAGVRMVLPAAIVGGILQRDMRNRGKVAIGAYNDELEAKIAEIRAACGIPAPAGDEAGDVSAS